MDNCVFGYGSLISRESRQKTGQSVKAVPVVLDGFKREWNKPSEKSKMSALGISKLDGVRCNGVIVEIPDGELVKFDMRERGYDRVDINRDSVNVLPGFNLPDGNLWAYVPKSPEKPSREFPIRQSYLDVILSGCLDFGRNFAEDFIQTTFGWDSVWLDDRHRPVYERAKFDSDVKKIDSILSQVIPNEFSSRKEETTKSLF